MSEKFPSKEHIPIPTKEEVVSSLSNNPEDLSVLHAYLDKRESIVRTSKDSLLLNVEVAHIYLEAGLAETARQALSDAADQAWEEYEDEIHQQLLATLKGLT